MMNILMKENTQQAQRSFGKDAAFSSLRRTSSIEVNTSLDGYDSGIGSSPLASSLPSQPPQSLYLSDKPKHRRRKRGPSTAAKSFHDVFERSGRVLGAGAFSSVEVCTDKKTKKEYAVKIINKENWYTRTRVLQEVEILYRGKGHPNIIQLEQYFEEDSQFYLVFEMMRGGALIDHIESLKTFTEKEAAIVVKCVTSALQHLHGQGIAHRDLKFENILCGDNFTEVKICDFDLGGQKFDLPYLSTPLMDSPVGSAEFMAPEVVSLFEGNHSFYDKSCDMWSLGVLIYIMIYGKPPFTGRCGLNCGWDTGEECKECQGSLFRNITYSELHFDDKIINVSESVKHLISNLLQKDSQLRLTAEEVLLHEWVVTEGTDNRLCTPQQLKRNKSSAINLYSFSSQANEHVRRINSTHSLQSSANSTHSLQSSANSTHSLQSSANSTHSLQSSENSTHSLQSSANSTHSLQSSAKSLEEDPLDRSMQDIDIGGSWSDNDDIFYAQDETLTNPPPYSPREPSPPCTPTDPELDNTPVQSSFVYPAHFGAQHDTKPASLPEQQNNDLLHCLNSTEPTYFDLPPNFYFSSDEED